MHPWVSKSEIQMKDAKVLKSTVSPVEEVPSFLLSPSPQAHFSYFPRPHKITWFVGGWNWRELTLVEPWEESCNLLPKPQVQFRGTGESGIVPSYPMTWLEEFLSPVLPGNRRVEPRYVLCLSGEDLRPLCRVSWGPGVARFSNALKRIVGRAESEWM